MIKISSIVIAKDESKNIGRCILSQIGVIDEIIVIVDSSTQDNTYEIASSFNNVKCEVAEWKGYSAMKSYALTKATNDWILWIDADEEITDELKKELISFKDSTPIHSAYKVARRAYFLGKWIKHSGWYPSRIVRLFDKHKAAYDDKSVHEGLTVSSTIGILQNDLNHYTDPSIEHYFQKFNAYTTLAANELFVKSRNVSIIDLLIRPVFLFLKMYIFKRGFLDGIHGFILALFSSAYVFTKYAKLWELNKSRSK